MRRFVPLPALACVVGLALPSAARARQTHEVVSPDGSLVATITVAPEPRFEIAWQGRPLVLPSRFGILLEGGPLPPMGGIEPIVERITRTDTIRPIIPEKRAAIVDHYDELSLGFGGGWWLDVRAYDDGLAYRFRTDRTVETTIQDEILDLRFPRGSRVWIPTEDSFLTHQERLYTETSLAEISPDTMGSTPLLVAPPDRPRVLVTEADLESYPGLYFKGTGGDGLVATFPAYPAAEEQVRDRTVRVTRREPFLARTRGPRTFPWRVFIVAEEDRDLVESTLVYQLGPEIRISDPSWIRPGKVAWDWWNASSLTGVDFRSGLNTDTYLYFVDFAADHGIDYVILDEGWSDPADLGELNFDMELHKILQRGEERGVGIILWVVWKTLEDQWDVAWDRFAEWGVAGIKVDFMQRDDQPMVDWYWKVAEEAARRHLLVDFHGAYKPTGLRRAYPNVLTREGVLGLEHSKWSREPTPNHNVTLPFIRMVAGPMDYTPGAMRNAQDQRFHAVFDRPMSLGTRAHQMAMYVVFESPLQMLADSPSNYLDEAECLTFLADVPTTWDETHVLSGQVGQWIAVARRKGRDWYVGAMAGWIPRNLDMDLSFLGPGPWVAEVFRDGANVQSNAEDYWHEEMVVDPAQPVLAHLGPGGGWVARIRPGN